MSTYKLMGGLGDCLLAAANLQKLNKPVWYRTNPLLKSLFDFHPTVHYTNTDEIDLEFKWVSQIKDQDLYPLHTMQRFSAQMGFYIDPTEVFNIYGAEGQMVNEPTRPIICINQFSNEPTRRYIPDEYLDLIVKRYNYEIVWIGSNNKKSITSIPVMMDYLLSCKLFIGPVSFCYHLASCLRTKSVLFTNYMPEHKFSHFFNTTAINPKNAPCRFTCEKDNVQCKVGCGAQVYDKQLMLDLIDRALYGGTAT